MPLEPWVGLSVKLVPEVPNRYLCLFDDKNDRDIVLHRCLWSVKGSHQLLEK